MSELIECPFCEYAAETEKSVRGHVSGKKDSAHSGHTYDELTEKLGSGASQSSTTNEAPDSGGADSSGSGPSFPAAPDSGGSDSGGCPDCGSDEYHTPAQLREAGLTAEELDEYERVCANCGELYNAE